ncbi:MAG: hypothetical protein FWG50_10370, partial [Kiritimatiellaeota bacterium]|nr:hypothetical protein [Kiritimatiellota bacterium]
MSEKNESENAANIRQTVTLAVMMVLVPVLLGIGFVAVFSLVSGLIGGFNSSSSGYGSTGGTTGSSGGGGSVGQNLDQMLANGSAVQYQRVVCYDPILGCEASRSFAPAGWQANGQVYWNMQSANTPATSEFFLCAPDGSAQIGIVGNMTFAQPDPSYNLYEGQWSTEDQCPVKTYQSAQVYAQSRFEEYLGLSYTQVVDVEYISGEAEQLFWGYIAGLQQEADNAMAQSAQYLAASNSSMAINYGGDAAMVTLRFEINGITYRAKVLVLLVGYDFTNTQNILLYGSVSTTKTVWYTINGFRYYLAEESRFAECERHA